MQNETKRGGLKALMFIGVQSQSRIGLRGWSVRGTSEALVLHVLTRFGFTCLTQAVYLGDRT